MNRVFLPLLFLLSTFPARACLWDNDTLEAEAKGIPDTIRVITGRFERNPALYYEMRLAHVTKELQSTPGALELYDDAGVACDRLHRGDEAIAWMEKKRAQMAKLKSSSPPGVLQTHRYRYLANLGTFIAHRWLRNGADRNKISEMKRARDLIRAAIKLNPNAHFGREKYQLKAMEWIIAPPKKKDGYPPVSSFVKEELSEKEAAATVKGLSGLIVLGDAWQSVDIFHALAIALENEGRSSVAYMAYLRCFELVDEGKRSLASSASKSTLKAQIKAGHYFHETSEYVRNYENLASHFKTLRAEADQWHTLRTAYIMERLKAGRHPDTDKTFWNEWQEPSAPSLYVPGSRDMYYRILRISLPVIAVLFLTWLTLRFARHIKAGG